jgi:hypothetical protein
MANNDVSLWNEIGRGLRPRFVAWIIDLMLAVMLWASIAVLHFVQLLTLRWGWSSDFVHFLDVAEEFAVFATVLVYFVASVLSYGFQTFRLVQANLGGNK